MWVTRSRWEKKENEGTRSRYEKNEKRTNTFIYNVTKKATLLQALKLYGEQGLFVYDDIGFNTCISMFIV